MSLYGQVGLPFTGIASFCKFPIFPDLEGLDADVAIFGLPWDEGVGYRPGTRFGPRSLREYSTRFAAREQGPGRKGFWNLDRKKRFLEGVRVVDCGDQDILYLNVEATFGAITASVEKILAAQAFPVLLGGDHSVTFPVIRAFGKYGPLHVVHLDAHLDYNDSVEGVRLAHGSPLKRVSELDFVGQIIQIGMRGNAREGSYRDSVSRGNHVLTISDFRRLGIQEVLSGIPPGPLYVTIDIDVLDPSIAPGTSSPVFNGLMYQEVRDLLIGIAGKKGVVGFDLVEVNPFLDPAGLTQSAGAMLILEFLGAIFDDLGPAGAKVGGQIG